MASGTWSVDASGNWSTTGNWSGAVVADGAGSTANFTNNITTGRTVTVDTLRTIGNITFSDAGAAGSAWTIATSGANTLTLNNSGSPSVLSFVTDATITGVLAGTGGFTMSGTNVTARFTGISTLSGPITINNTGTGYWGGVPFFGSAGVNGTGTTTNVFPNATSITLTGTSTQASLILLHSNNAAYTFPPVAGNGGPLLVSMYNAATYAANGITFSDMTGFNNAVDMWQNNPSIVNNARSVIGVKKFPAVGNTNAKFWFHNSNGEVLSATVLTTLTIPSDATASTTPAALHFQIDSNNSIGSGTTFWTTGVYANQSSGAMTFTGAVYRQDFPGNNNTNVPVVYATFGGSNNENNTISGTISSLSQGNGGLAILKADAGRWVFSGTNTYAGGNTINGGSLRGASAAAFGTGSITVGASGAAEFFGGFSFANNINASGTLRNVSGNNSLTGTSLVLAAATVIESLADTLTVNLGSGASITGATQPLTFSGAGNHTVTSVIATTTGTVTKNGAGTTTLNGANSFSGAITHNAGVIAANSITASGNNSLGTGTTFTFGGAATLRYTGSTPATLSKATVSIPASGAVFENNGTGAWTVSSLTAASANTVLGLAGSNAGYNKLSPAATPANLVGFTKTGAGRWISTLNVNPASSGSTAVNAGTLVASNSNGTSKLFGYDVTVASGAMIQTGSDEVGQAGKCAYNNLTFNGAAGTPARIRIGGSVVNPTIYMNGNLALPVSGTVTFNVTADVFKTPGTYTLVEFAGAFGVTGGTVAANAVAVAPTGRTGTLAYVAGTPNRITVTIA